MHKRTIEAIEKYAIEQYPREACGFVVREGRKELFIPVENRASASEEMFRISGEDYMNIVDAYDVKALVHSHPDHHSRPSEGDKVMCEQTNLPWVIVGLTKDLDTGLITVNGMTTFAPEGYRAPLEGREFFHGVLDCYSLVRDYYKEKLSIELTNYQRDDRWWENPEGESLYMKYFADEGFIAVQDGTLKEHDILLMEIRSNCGPNHAGVYTGDKLMLHHLAGRVSTKAVYVGGYYQLNTRMVIRHRSQL